MGVEILKSEYAGLNTGLYPGFEEETILENENKVIKRERFGRIIKDFKEKIPMPEWLEFPVKDKRDLEKIIP